jgi:excisionase family DNA binding protein
MKKMKPVVDKPIYTTRTAAQQLGVSLRTVQLWVDSGILQAWKTPGGHRRVTINSVKKLLQQSGTQVVHHTDRDRDQGYVVLLIEDDADLLRFYQLTINSWGLPLNLVTAENGCEGLMRIGELQPDLIVTDLVMPGLDGFDMIHSLRANPLLSDTDVIVMTSMTQMEIDDRGGLPQDYSVLFKPVSFAQMRSQVVISMKQARRKNSPTMTTNFSI